MPRRARSSGASRRRAGARAPAGRVSRAATASASGTPGRPSQVTSSDACSGGRVRGAGRKPSAIPAATAARGKEKAESNSRYRGTQRGWYRAVVRYRVCSCQNRDATTRAALPVRTSGPALTRSAASKTLRRTAKFSETRPTPRSGHSSSRAAIIASVTPFTASSARRMRSSDSPSPPHGT